MDKEKEQKSDSSYSEKRLDLSVDKTKNQNAVKGGNIFDSKKVKKSK